MGHHIALLQSALAMSLVTTTHEFCFYFPSGREEPFWPILKKLKLNRASDVCITV